MIRSAGAAALVGGLAACSGSNGATPQPSPSSTPPVSVPAVDSAEMLTGLAIGALQADAVLATLVRPGRSSLLTPPNAAAQAPVCDPATASARSVTLGPGGTTTVVRTAIYPPGDTTCSQAPEIVAVIGYPLAAGGVQDGYGYLDNTSISGLFANVVLGTEGIYVVEAGGTLDFLPVIAAPAVALPQLTPGPFPASFPSSFPDETAAVEANVAGGIIDQWYAIGGTPQALRAAWYPGALFPNVTGASYAVSDAQTLNATASGSRTTIAASAADPQFALSRTATDPATVVSSFPLAPGALQFPVGTRAGVGQTSDAQNFSTPVVNTATFLSDGTIVAAHQTYVDSVAKVEVDLLSTDGRTFTLTVTDLLRNQTITSPSPIVLTPVPFDRATGSPGVCKYAYTLFSLPSGPQYTTPSLEGFTCPSSTAPASQTKTLRRVSG
jgi:hypothetical protein